VPWSELGPATWVALLAAAGAVVQLAAASRRDLGAIPIAAGGAALVLAGQGSPLLGGALGVAAVVAAVAWARAAAHAVGRPEVNGLVLAVVVLAASARGWAPTVVPGVPDDAVRGAAVAPCVLAGVLGVVLALERPGPRRSRPPARIHVPVVEEPGDGAPG